MNSENDEDCEYPPRNMNTVKKIILPMSHEKYDRIMGYSRHSYNYNNADDTDEDSNYIEDSNDNSNYIEDSNNINRVIMNIEDDRLDYNYSNDNYNNNTNTNNYNNSNFDNGNDTDPSMPGLCTDSDDDWDKQERNMASDDGEDDDPFGNIRNITINNEFCENEEKEDDDIIKNLNINTINKDIYYNNNLKYDYQRIGIGKSYISGASAYPPELFSEATLGALNTETNKLTNCYIDSKGINILQENVFLDEERVDISITPDTLQFISDSNVKFENKEDSESENCCVIIGSTQICEIENELEQIVTDENTIIIENKLQKWWINAYICDENDKVIKVKLFADSGANAGCVKTSWALKHFPNFIQRNNKSNKLNTPNGPITPKYVLWLTFPTKSGKILKARMYLVNELPVDILADINMLEHFGYVFRDETPEIFKNINVDDYDDMELLEDKKVNEETPYENYIKKKHQYYEKPSHDNKPMSYNKLYGVNTLLYNDNDIDKIKIKGKPTKNDDKCEDPNYTDVYLHKSDKEIKIENVNENNIIKLRNIRKVVDKTIEQVSDHYEKCYTKRGFETHSYGYHYCLFIMAKQSFLASRDEIAKALAIQKQQNLQLYLNRLDYLKSYPKKYGPRFNNLYSAVMRCINNNWDCFAEWTFERHTLNVEPKHLGIDPKHRSKTMYAVPYPISALKRLSMINYTILNEENGFWKPVDVSLHCIPYTMVPKKRNGVIYRYRPAFDGRVVNQYCILMNSNMPTIRDFRDLQSIRGFTTMADIKNFFDCIPLAIVDQKYACAMTPMGIYMMSCLTYGWMNAAPNAQNITNKLCLHMGLSLAYIDDIQLKHPFNNGTQDIIDKLEKFFKYLRKINCKLDPTKFFPCTDKNEGFSFQWDLIGKSVAKSYTDKILALKPPETWKQMEHWIGMVGYIRNHVYNCSAFTYWLQELKQHCGEKGKIKWTPQGELAFQQLQYLIANAPILHHPTREGEYCIQTDACNFGVGAVLFQKQRPLNEKEEKWVIVDMWSKMIPKALRHCHSMVHEAYAIVGACEYWQFQLMKRKFKVSTDNSPVANIFNKQKWYHLSSITQKQLLRLRMTMDLFDYETYHVPGLDNKLADSLSRFTAKLIKMPDTGARIRAINSRDTNNKPLTKEDLDYFEEYKNKCKSLNINNGKIDSFNSISTMLNQITADEIIEDKHNIVLNIRNDHWNSLLKNYIDNSPYLYKDRVKDLVQAAASQTVTGNENDLNDNTIINSLESLDEMLDLLSKISRNLKFQIKQTLYKLQLNQKHKERNGINLIAPIRNDELVESDISDSDEPMEEVKSNKRSEEYRAKLRSNKKRKRKRIFNTKLQDIIFANKRLTMQTRSEFMQDVFGYRKGKNIFDLKLIKQHQNNDEKLRLIIQMLGQSNKERKEEDLKYLFEWDKILYRKLIEKEFNLKDDILYVKTKTSTSRNKSIWCIVIPFNIRGKIMDYSHHNLQLHHYGEKQTLEFIESRFWWTTLKKDVKWFCKTCLTCQYTKGSIRHRAPMTVRELPKRLTHIFADFLGPIYGKYYILVLIDYTTGYTLLIPTVGCDSNVVIDNLLGKWIPSFGWFKIFESDWGSGFNNKLMRLLMKTINIKHEIAEPRNHRSIGKVERIIGYVQRVLNRYNIELGELLTDPNQDHSLKWETVETILPFIQMSINQHRPRFTTFSPNMLLFGSNMNDIIDYTNVLNKLDNIQSELNVKDHDYVLLQNLIKQIVKINKNFKNDWKRYTWVTKENYDKKWNINENKINANRERFKLNDEILYYVGDRRVEQYKWKQKWTGPWIIDKILNDNTIIIGDPETGNQKRVTIDRCKTFHKREMYNYAEYFGNDDNYIGNDDELRYMYTKYNADIREQDFNLDFRN